MSELDINHAKPNRAFILSQLGINHARSDRAFSVIQTLI